MTIRVLADHDLCDGYGNCAAQAPEVFDVGDDDLVKILVPEVPVELEGAVRDAVLSCPKSALSLEE